MKIILKKKKIVLNFIEKNLYDNNSKENIMVEAEKLEKIQINC